MKSMSANTILTTPMPSTSTSPTKPYSSSFKGILEWKSRDIPSRSTPDCPSPPTPAQQTSSSLRVWWRSTTNGSGNYWHTKFSSIATVFFLTIRRLETVPPTEARHHRTRPQRHFRLVTVQQIREKSISKLHTTDHCLRRYHHSRL